MTVDKRNTIIQVNRAAKTAMEVFDDILVKPRLDRNDLQLIIQKIRVFEDHLEIQLKADIDSILQSGSLPEEEAVAAMVPVSFRPYEIQIVQESDSTTTGFSLSKLSATATLWRFTRIRTAVSFLRSIHSWAGW